MRFKPTNTEPPHAHERPSYRKPLPPRAPMPIFPACTMPANLNPSRTLATLRDKLLPEPLSGELSVALAL